MPALAFSIAIGTLHAQTAPFLPTTWNQGCHYNELCPPTSSGGSCGKVWTGCNATAIAQIFKYYAYPNVGLGGYHCNAVDTNYCVDFSDQTYDYSMMPNAVTAPNAAVAKLMYDIGVAVNMDWGGAASNSFFSTVPMKRYFAYSPAMHGVLAAQFPLEELIKVLKAELDAGRPVFAKGGAHFYLIDGYNLDNKFHCNFGWGGLHDGYYAITSVSNPAGNFTPSNFLVNIAPMTGTMECVQDTIILSKSAHSNVNIEFTSTLDWTMTPDAAWITVQITNGSAGYYNFLNGTNFSAAANTGPERVSHVAVQNNTITRLVTVIQEGVPVGTDNQANTTAFQVFPNPATDVIYLQSLNKTVPSKGICQILDLTGQILKHQDISGMLDIQISTESLPNGTYLVQVTSEQGTMLRKFIIARS